MSYTSTEKSLALDPQIQARTRNDFDLANLHCIPRDRSRWLQCIVV